MVEMKYVFSIEIKIRAKEIEKDSTREREKVEWGKSMKYDRIWCKV